MLLSTGAFFNHGGGGGGGPTYPLDGFSPTGAWSMSRDLLSAFAGGSRYTDSSGAVSSLNDQSGNTRHLTDAGTAARRPTVATGGPNSRTCADFDGSTDFLTGAAISNFISNSAGYMIVSWLADAITLNVAQSYNNHLILGDAGQFMGLYLRDTGSPDTVYGFNWDGNEDRGVDATIAVSTAYVTEWRHDGGNVYVRVNGGTWQSAASGNTSTMTNALLLGGRNGAQQFNGKIFEAAVFSTVPGSTDRDAFEADFRAWVGA